MFAWLFAAGTFLLVAVVTPAVAWADQPAQATQHALDELANCRAQHRPECPTETPTPTATSTPSPVPPTATPTRTVTPEPTLTPQPALPVPEGEAEASAAYVRPSTLDAASVGPAWLELALDRGRWNVHVVTTECGERLGEWADVWLMYGPLIVPRGPYLLDPAEWEGCRIDMSVWHATVPCATDGDGVCSASADPIWLSLAPPETELPMVAVVQPLPPPPVAPPAAPPAAAPVRQVVQYVYAPTAVPQIVVVTATPLPTAVVPGRPTTAPAATATLAPPTAFWWQMTPTPVPTVEPTPEPTPERVAEAPSDPPGPGWIEMGMGGVGDLFGLAWGAVPGAFAILTLAAALGLVLFAPISAALTTYRNREDPRAW
jgi:hypothetical protein